jgi:hypothetical protein
MGVKTDNHDPSAKLALRRYFLAKYHADGCAVLDCFQGSGLLWGVLRKEFQVNSYWGVDVKPKKGRLKIDSARILAQPGWTQDVIDMDAYGSPWKHWEEFLRNCNHPATAFLTIGQLKTGTVGALSNKALEAMGLLPLASGLPKAFHVKLGEYSVGACLSMLFDFGKTCVEAVEAVSNGNCRYIGVRIRPASSPKPAAKTMATKC